MSDEWVDVIRVEGFEEILEFGVELNGETPQMVQLARDTGVVLVQLWCMPNCPIPPVPWSSFSEPWEPKTTWSAMINPIIVPYEQFVTLQIKGPLPRKAIIKLSKEQYVWYEGAKV